MTVLAWLLLYATVIQLGQSNYSISSEDGTYEVNSYANNKFPFIDRSQIRRTRRSVDSDLEDAKTALGIAEETLKKAEGERQKASTTLSELEGSLTKAKELATVQEGVYNNALGTENRLETNLNNANDAVEPAEKAFNEADTAFNNSMLAWTNKEEAERKTAEGKYTNAKNEKATADTKLTTATGLASKMKELKDKYDTEQTTKKKYEADIQLFEHNHKFETTIETENENIKNNKLKKNVEDAQKENNDRENDKNAIEKNEILNGGIDEDFSVKTVKDVKYEKEGIIDKGVPELEKMPKDSTEFTELQKNIDYARKVVESIEDLLKIDPEYKDKKIKEVQSQYTTMLEAAKKAFAAAADKLKNAKEPLEAAQKKIKDAQTELDKVDIKAITTAKDTAEGEMKQVEENIKKYTDDLDTFSTANGGNKGETEWIKLKGILDGDVSAKTTALNTAKQAEINAQNDYTQKKTAADTKLKSINEDEGNKRDIKFTAKTNAENAKITAQREKDEFKDYLKAKKNDYDSAKDRVTELEGEIKKAKTALRAKQDEEYIALTAQRGAATKFEEAKAKKAEADALAKKQAADAAAAAAAEEKRKEDEAAAAAKKEREHQDQVRALSLGFGSTAGIVVIGAAIGLSVFFVMRRRRKQKKAAEVKVPKREELDAPNGLTIIRREGMQDKYVIKGDDFNFRGPLVRGRVHNEVSTKHMLDDQVGGDKIENIFFDKKLNDAYLIGEGVEIVEEDSVSVSEGKKTGRLDPVELLANMSAEDMAGSSQKYIKDSDGKAAQQPGDKKSSKSKRAKAATPKKGGAPTDGEKAPLLGENKKA